MDSFLIQLFSQIQAGYNAISRRRRGLVRSAAGRFNVANNNTIQAIRGTQNADNANEIQGLTAPRVVRFGLNVNW